MNLRQLTVFCRVCEEMSFTRAAKRLYMTQPAVSHVVAELEQETGCVLFEPYRPQDLPHRRGKGVL